MSPLGLYSIIIGAFILMPILVVVVASFTASAYIAFPPRGWSLQGYANIFRRPEFIESARLSLIVATTTSVSATILGVAAAMGLTRYRFPGRELLTIFFLSPLMLPAVVFGLAMLLVYAQIGILGTPFGIVTGHVIVTTPYVIRLVGASLVGFDRSIELAAKSLGATGWETFRRITLPLILPGVVAGAIFAFLLSWDEVNVAVFLTSTAVTTLPVRIFSYVAGTTADPFILAVGSSLTIVAVVGLVVIDRIVGVGKVFGAE